MNQKFKPGDLAWSPFNGFRVVASIDPRSVYVVSHGSYDFTAEGKFRYSDIHTTLLTVEEAAKLGYFPPKKKVKKTIKR